MCNTPLLIYSILYISVVRLIHRVPPVSCLLSQEERGETGWEGGTYRGSGLTKGDVVYPKHTHVYVLTGPYNDQWL